MKAPQTAFVAAVEALTFNCGAVSLENPMSVPVAIETTIRVEASDLARLIAEREELKSLRASIAAQARQQTSEADTIGSLRAEVWKVKAEGVQRLAKAHDAVLAEQNTTESLRRELKDVRAELVRVTRERDTAETDRRAAVERIADLEGRS